ncbi:Sec-independent protein translocase subunit TatA [Otariodibacter sp.]|uniref:Sec-independent protein translocase subunit TatA n=1 Tax=Otariodibacter sp. TaxID=3030919 RepID=UPI002618D3DC|nr:Sec-independent protein translocase subunit TatA [Otariodibacter sp.]
MGGISVWQLLIVAVIILLLFGTKKLRNLGSDLGESVKGFKKAMSDDDKSKDAEFDKVEKKQAESTKEQKAKEKEQA